MVDAFRFNTHAQLHRVALEFGLLDVLGEGGIDRKTTRLIEHLVRNPTLTGPLGGPLVMELVERAIHDRCNEPWQDNDPDRVLPELSNALRQDGYLLVDRRVKPAYPVDVPLAAAEDELSQLLHKHRFDVAGGHLDQATSAHARGDWAAANAQIRSFVEELFDRIASGLSQGDTDQLPTSNERRTWLATSCIPPFFDPDLNEWEGGRGFVPGLWKRLHPQGSHPGLSDEADATFRLHIVLLTGLLFMRRYDARLEDRTAMR